MNNTNTDLAEQLKEIKPEVIIVGAGLAGSECAWQLQKAGIKRIALIEQRPIQKTEAHRTERFAELVCSNSLKSTDPDSAPGQLKWELEQLDSLIIKAAREARVPAGQALGVDRILFSQIVSQKLEEAESVFIVRQHVADYKELLGPGCPIVLATGPLTHKSLAESLEPHIGTQLYFYDAIAPIVEGDSINLDIAFRQNRYDKGDAGIKSDEVGDYINCPFNKEEYENFIAEIQKAQKFQPHDFETAIYFSGCQPIEAMLERGENTLRFGPMKPKGITDPRTGERPHAVLQLRSEDSEGRSWNLVGFQTKMMYPEQKRIFRMIPGLEDANFYRFGSMHRNTFINSQDLLTHSFALKTESKLHFAGQITGAEGYTESTAIGALIGRQIAHKLLHANEADLLPPQSTAIGSLAHFLVNNKVKNFQPTNINWGLVPLEDLQFNRRDKKDKKAKLSERARNDFSQWLDKTNKNNLATTEDFKLVSPSLSPS